MILLYRYNSYIYKNYNGRGVSKIMSSLQKFHRRTMSLGPVTWPPTAIGGGDVANGYWLGGPTFNALVVAPKSTEVQSRWGSYGTVRGTTSTTDGLTNTNTLYSFGSSNASGHPAAYYTKTLTTGGYTTWYLPAKNELLTMYSNKSAVPFATANSFVIAEATYWNSTEDSGPNAWGQYMPNGGQYIGAKVSTTRYVRATRRYTFPTATIGDGSATTGYWLGTAGDGVSKLIVAPKSSEVQRAWGSYGTARGTTSTSNGLTNTNTLYSLGSAAHPAAYYCKTLTSGGYNSWYFPAKDELNTLYSNKSAVPFATANGFGEVEYLSSTEFNGSSIKGQNFASGGGYQGNYNKVYGGRYIRPVRRV
jgi:hypothetical protein